MSMCRRRASATSARVLVSDQAGKSNILAELERLGVAGRPRTIRACRACSKRSRSKEAQGYAYEAADASFELLARAHARRCARFFRGRALSRRRRAPLITRRASSISVSEAVVKVDRRRTLISAAEGNGPVNALDLALRKDLGKYQQLHRGPRAASTTGARVPGRHRRGDAGADRVRRRRRRDTGRPSASRPTSSTPRSRRCSRASSTGW